MLARPVLLFRLFLRTVVPALILSVLVSGRPVHAAAFAVNDQSAAGTALAGALTARPDDASAIFYNPAGLAFQEGIGALAGFTFLTAQPLLTTTTGLSSTTFAAQRGYFVLPTLYFAARLTKQLSLGLGAFVSHGLTVDWQNPDNPASFPGRYQALRAGLQTFTLNPTLAVHPIPEIGLAVGLDVVLGSFELWRNLNFGDADGLLALSGGAATVGANIGALASLAGGKLNLGLSYRSSFTLHFDNAKVGYTPPALVSAAPFPYTKAQTEIGMPHTIAAGLSVRATSWLTLSAEVNATLWSDTQDLKLTLSDDAGKVTQQQAVARKWHDAYAGRLGIEADLHQAVCGGRSPFLPKVRFGFAYDQSPVPDSTLDPSLPDGDRFEAAVGTSLGYRGVGSIDVGYKAVFVSSRSSQNPDLGGFYESTTAHVLSLALVLKYDRQARK